MWDEQRSARFQDLRSRETLSEAEQIELAALTRDLQAQEAAYLKPATERLGRERDALEVKNRSLAELVHRREALVRRLHEFLTEAETERRAIDRELAAVLATTRSAADE